MSQDSPSPLAKPESRDWIRTIEENKGYRAPDPAEFRTYLNRIGSYVFFNALFRHVRTGDTALEAGCGWAVSSFALAERGIRVTAIDIAEKLVADLDVLRKQLGGPYERNLIVRTGDIFRLPALNTTFDVVFSDGTYEHFADPADRVKILENVRSVLKERGILIVAVPNLQNPFFGSVVDERMPAMHPFTVESLAAELGGEGFDVLETGYSFVNPGFAQWVRSPWMIGAIRACGFFFGWLPRPLKRLLAAHLYCVAQKR